MKYDFDEVIERRGTYCTQWDYIVFYFRYRLPDSQADQRHDSKGGTARNIRLYQMESSRF